MELSMCRLFVDFLSKFPPVFQDLRIFQIRIYWNSQLLNASGFPIGVFPNWEIYFVSD